MTDAKKFAEEVKKSREQMLLSQEKFAQSYVMCNIIINIKRGRSP